MVRKTIEEVEVEFFAYIATLKANNDLKYPKDVNTTQKAHLEFSVYVRNLKVFSNQKCPQATESKKDVHSDTCEKVVTMQHVHCEIKKNNTMDEPVECVTSKPGITHECTVKGPCFGKKYSSKKALNVHIANKHGDQEKAKERSLHANALQVKSRKKRKENVNGVEERGV
jgi:hypothetical protein